MSRLDEQRNFLELIAPCLVLVLVAALEDSKRFAVEIKIGTRLRVPGQSQGLESLAGMVQDNVGEQGVVSLRHTIVLLITLRMSVAHDV